MALTDKKFKRILVIRGEAPAPAFINLLHEFTDETVVLNAAHEGVIGNIAALGQHCVIVDGRSLDATSAGIMLGQAARHQRACIVYIHPLLSQLSDAGWWIQSLSQASFVGVSSSELPLKQELRAALSEQDPH